VLFQVQLTYSNIRTTQVAGMQKCRTHGIDILTYYTEFLKMVTPLPDHAPDTINLCNRICAA